MNLLYFGRYKRRFAPVLDLLKHLPAGARILELCFGDIYIADFSRRAGYQWCGVDINERFVKHAQKLGYDARYSDLTSPESLSKADICIMIGSLYHFHPGTSKMLSKMLDASSSVVISEPVSNLSSMSGPLGFIARRAANAGKGDEKFRYNTESFLAMLKKHSVELDYSIDSVYHHGKDLIVKLQKNGKN